MRELAERALARGALLEDETADGPVYYLPAFALSIAEDLQTAEAALTAAVEDARTRGSVLGFANASHMRSVAILLRGRIPDAAADARQALAVERHGWRLSLGGARVVLANCLIERGDFRAARRHLAAAEAGPGEHAATHSAMLITRARLAFLEGNVEAALADYRRCGELGPDAGADNPAMSPWRSSAAIALAVLGQTDEANELAERELELAEAFGAPGPIGRALRGIGMIRGPEAGLEALEAAVQTLEGSQAALERARTLVEFGAALRRSGRRRDAREPLRLGLDLAQRCGAEALVARAKNEAKTAGARPRRTAVSGVDALTERERQVAAARRSRPLEPPDRRSARRDGQDGRVASGPQLPQAGRGLAREAARSARALTQVFRRSCRYRIWMVTMRRIPLLLEPFGIEAIEYQALTLGPHARRVRRAGRALPPRLAAAREGRELPRRASGRVAARPYGRARAGCLGGARGRGVRRRRHGGAAARAGLARAGRGHRLGPRGGPDLRRDRLAGDHGSRVELPERMPEARRGRGDAGRAPSSRSCRSARRSRSARGPAMWRRTSTSRWSWGRRWKASRSDCERSKPTCS